VIEERQKPRRSTRNITSPRQQSSLSGSSSATTQKKPQQDPITFLSELNVSFSLISTISQEIISLYTLWDRYKEDANPEAKTPSLSNTYPLHPHSQPYTHLSFTSSNPFPLPPLPNMPISNTFPDDLMSMPLPMSLPAQGNPNSSHDASNIDIISLCGPGNVNSTEDGADITVEGMKDGSVDGSDHDQPVDFTVTPMYLSALLLEMRETRAVDVAQQRQRDVNDSIRAVGVGSGYVHGIHAVHGVHYAPVHGHGHSQSSVIHGYGQVHGVSGGMIAGMRM